MGRRVLKDPAKAVVERIDPQTLEPIASSPDLAAGPWWAGGIAVIADGSLISVSGRWIHRLDPDTLEPIAARELPANRPYNSFVVLADGTIVTKDFDHNLREPATVHAIDPVTLEDRAEPLQLPETVIARLSADESGIYAVGVSTAMRVLFDGSSLTLDDWNHRYLTDPGQSYGWDPVIGAERLWFLDQGRHRFRVSMRGSGLDSGQVHLHSIPLEEAGGATRVAICGESHGSITNPPLIDPERMIAVGYDSANGRMAGWDIPDDPASAPLLKWERAIHSGPHLIRYPDTGEIIVADHRAPWPTSTRAFSRLIDGALSDALRRSHERNPELEPKIASRISGEDMVVLDIETGEEKARATMPLFAQSVMFPTPLGNRDVLMSTVTGLFRCGVVSRS
jgi:hypothetical protein